MMLPLLLGPLGLLFNPTQAITLPSGYDTVWTTQSSNAAGSMPVGGGDLGLNVWVENGDILFYAQQSGAFDENNSLLKLGRFRLRMNPNPFATNAGNFEQRLRINQGDIVISGANSTKVNIWVDMDTSTIHTSLSSGISVNLTAGFETWRTQGYTLNAPAQQQTSWGVNSVSQIPAPYQYPDTASYTAGGVLNYHHNSQTPLFDFQVKQQGIQNSDSFFNPMKNNTFGSFMFSPQLTQGATTTGKYLDTAYTSYNLVSKAKGKSFTLVIGTNQTQTTDVNGWLSNLVSAAKNSVSTTQQATLNWWSSFWDRSYILINTNAGNSDSGFQVGKNYQYFRYMMACNAKGKYPMRFNGGLFTFDPVLTDGNNHFTPDYRKWSGGTFTAQNQRLLYWPLLKTGDFDIMQQQFNYYSNISPNSRKLGQQYFGIDAGLTSEQIDNTGLPNVYEYDANAYGGQTRTSLYPAGIDFNDYLSWLADTANEFADMVLLAKSTFGANVSKWVSFVEYQLAWFDAFYRKRNGLDSKGKLIIYPASGAETYKLALNPSSTVSGLRRVISDLMSSGVSYVRGNSSYYTDFYNRVPDTPLQACPGTPSLTCIAPATNYSFTQNDECTSMYPVFPWGEYGLGQPTNLNIAKNTYFNDSQSAGFHGYYGWRQDQIWHARMGLTQLATENTAYRLADSTNYRFSAFKGPNYDWSPDINHYGSAAIGLQEQLLQTFAKNNSQIRLLGAWPSQWDATFKLSAPKQTTVSGQVSNGQVSNLVVSPSSRMSDVVYGQS